MVLPEVRGTQRRPEVLGLRNEEAEVMPTRNPYRKQRKKKHVPNTLGHCKQCGYYLDDHDGLARGKPICPRKK